jgi:hypothetical protein
VQGDIKDDRTSYTRSPDEIMLTNAAVKSELKDSEKKLEAARQEDNHWREAAQVRSRPLNTLSTTSCLLSKQPPS